jgi:phage/conjugal plasmid C-4 type zinc finger TraR family protein
MEEINTQHSNMEEAEMGQLQALHLNMNAIAAHRKAMDLKASKPSLAECEECGEDIPEARQLAVAGCTTCIWCQSKLEKKK